MTRREQIGMAVIAAAFVALAFLPALLSLGVLLLGGALDALFALDAVLGLVLLADALRSWGYEYSTRAGASGANTTGICAVGI